MTKKHFISLANHIRWYNKLYPKKKFTVAQLEALTAFCRFKNPNFNTQRWLDYIAGKCGPSGGKVE